MLIIFDVKRMTVGIGVKKIIFKLSGDVLLSAGFIAYLGPYTVNYRREIIQVWNERTKELSE